MITGFHHGNIIVSDLDRAKKFYTEVLGLTVAMETEIDDAEFARGVNIPGTKVRGIFFSVPNTPTMIEMFQYVAPDKSKSHNPGERASDIGIGHLAFQVSDIDAAYERLRDKGVSFVSSPVKIADSHKDVGGVRFCYFRDPDGTLLELIYLPGH
jgi:catechol 2,3-dioxygenase-like lactoylglutathione lyase family enzyme